MFVCYSNVLEIPPSYASAQMTRFNFLPTSELIIPHNLAEDVTCTRKGENVASNKVAGIG